MLSNFNDLKEKLAKSSKKTIAVAAAQDFHTLEAVFDAAKEFGVDYIFTGVKKEILAVCAELGQTIDEEKIIETENDEEAAKIAVSLIREKHADILMKGKLQTATLLKAVLNKETGIRSGSAMSHMAVLECPNHDRLLFMSDGGMIPYPDLEQKRAILENGVNFMHSLGYDKPNVAVLAAVESVNEKMPETLHAAELAKLNTDGEIANCIVEGPLSFDLAISQESAAIKGIESRVSGNTDMLLMPNIATGNIMSKALLYLGGAKMAGCILGAKVPIVLVSRGASAEEKRLSILLCLCSKNK